MWPNPQFPADLAIFTEEILNRKLRFLCSDYTMSLFLKHLIVTFENIVFLRKIYMIWSSSFYRKSYVIWNITAPYFLKLRKNTEINYENKNLTYCEISPHCTKIGVWSHLLNKSLIEIFFFCAVLVIKRGVHYYLRQHLEIEPIVTIIMGKWCFFTSFSQHLRYIFV